MDNISGETEKKEGRKKILQFMLMQNYVTTL